MSNSTLRDASAHSQTLCSIKNRNSPLNIEQMKNCIVLVLSTLLFMTSCRSFDPALLQSTGDPFQPKLPTLKPIVENNIVAIVSADGSTIQGANPFDVKSYFENEVKDIMTEPYGEKKGVIKLKVQNYEQKIGMPMLIYLPILYLPTLFGATAYTGHSSVGVEIEVMTPSGRTIGEYTGTGEHKEKGALWKDPKSYKSKDIQRVAYLKSIKKAVQEAKNKMIQDIPRLNNELKN